VRELVKRVKKVEKGRDVKDIKVFMMKRRV